MLQLDLRLVELFLKLARGFQPVAFRLPFGRHLGRTFGKVRKLLLKGLKPVLRRRIVFLLQRLGLDLLLQDLAIQRVKLLGLRIHLHPQAAGGFVDKVDGLVGQKTVGDVAVRQRRRGHQGGVGDFHPVVKLILFLDSAEDGDCVLHRRLIDHDRLEAAGKGRVLLHILAVFIQRRRAYAVQLAPRQGRLDEVRRIHRAVGLARADEGVHLVDEQDDLARGGLDFLED